MKGINPKPCFVLAFLLAYGWMNEDPYIITVRVASCLIKHYLCPDFTKYVTTPTLCRSTTIWRMLCCRNMINVLCNVRYIYMNLIIHEIIIILPLSSLFIRNSNTVATVLCKHTHTELWIYFIIFSGYRNEMSIVFRKCSWISQLYVYPHTL